MNTNPKTESQPRRSSFFGLISLVAALLTIGYILYLPVFPVFLALSAIAIIAGGTDLYLTNRKIPVGAILTLIPDLILLATSVLKVISIPVGIGSLLIAGFFLWGFVYAILQIVLLLRNRDVILARLGIALVLLCKVFAGVAIFIHGSMGQ